MEVELLEPQFDLLTCEEKFALFVGGIGTGKSITLAHFCVQQIIKHPHSNGLVVANTYKQLIDATVQKMCQIFDNLGIQYRLVLGTTKYFRIGKKQKIYLYSLEVPDNIRGIEVGFIAADELAFSTAAAFKIILGRLRCPKGSGKFRGFTSPNGFNWFYDLHLRTKTFTMKTEDNPYNQEGYFESLLDQYGGPTSALARQELFAEFVNQTSNSVYYNFKKEHVCPVIDDPMKPVYIGLDFNVGNMNYVVSQYDPKDGIKIIEAIQLSDHYANTFSVAEDIHRRYGSRAIIIPDSTAKARKTNAQAGLTDIKILENYGLKIMPFQNPMIKDRHNTVNLLFHKNRIRIDPKSKDLIADLNKLSTKDNEGKVSHLAVALGYICWAFEPLLIQKQSTIEDTIFGKK